MKRCAFGFHHILTSLLLVSPLALAAPGSTLDDDGQGKSYGLRSLAELSDVKKVLAAPDMPFVAIYETNHEVSSNSISARWLILDVQRQMQLHTLDAGAPLFSRTVTGLPVGNFRPGAGVWLANGQFVYAVWSGEMSTIYLYSSEKQRDIVLAKLDYEVVKLAWEKSRGAIVATHGVNEADRRSALDTEGAKGYLYDGRFSFYSGARPAYRQFDDIRSTWRMRDKDYGFTLISLSGKVLAGTDATDDEITGGDKNELIFEDPQRRGSIKIAPNQRDAAWLTLADESLSGVNAPLRVVWQSRGEMDRTECQLPQCVGIIEEVVWSYDSRRLYFVKRQGHALHQRALHYWAPSENVVKTVNVTNGVIDSCGPVARALVCRIEDITIPTRVVAFEDRADSLVELYAPNADFDPIDSLNVKKLLWADGFGNETFGYLVLPPVASNQQALPLVIVQYRVKGFLRGGVGNEYPIFSLAQAGFAVLAFDEPEDWSLRATVSDPVELTSLEWREFYEQRRSLTAQRIVLEELFETGMIDPSRVAITGLSSGADNVVFGLVNSDLFSVAITSGGSWSPTSYYLSSFRAQEFNRSRGFGDYRSPEGTNWKGISLALNSNKVNTPLLIHAADSEYLRDLEAVTTLRALNKPVELYVFPDEWHIKWQPIHRYNIYRRNLQWLQFWLQDKEAADPVDSDQYARWKRLREQHCANLTSNVELSALPPFCDTTRLRDH